MTLRIGILGCGLMGQQHASGYLAAPELSRVVMCCDDRPEAAQKLAATCGDEVRVTTHWQDVIASAEVDAVSVCMPHDLHAPVVLAAAAAGKHILLEKPLALNLTEGQAMVQAADEAGVTFMVAQNQRFLPEHHRVKALLDSGAIGRVFAARVDGNQWLSRIYPPGHWLFSQARTGGGVIRTTAIHKLDLLRFLLGEIRRVVAFKTNSGLNPEMDNEDVAVIALEFESGAVGEAFFTFGAHRAPIPTATHELTIFYGEQGVLQNVMGWHLYSAVLPEYSSGFTRLDLPDADYPQTFRNEVRHFLEAVSSASEPLTSGRDNLNTLAVVDAIYESIASGQAVTVQHTRKEIA